MKHSTKGAVSNWPCACGHEGILIAVRKKAAPNDGGRGVPQEKRLWRELQLSGWRPSIFRWTPEQSRKGDRGRERQMWRELHPMALWMAAGSTCDVSRGYKSYKHLSLSFPPEKGRFIIKKGFGASCNQ